MKDLKTPELECCRHSNHGERGDEWGTARRRVSKRTAGRLRREIKLFLFALFRAVPLSLPWIRDLNRRGFLRYMIMSAQSDTQTFPSLVNNWVTCLLTMEGIVATNLLFKHTLYAFITQQMNTGLGYCITAYPSWRTYCLTFILIIFRCWFSPFTHS